MSAVHPVFQQLAVIRHEKRITQRELAGLLHLHQKAISHRESGHSSHGLFEVDRHARELGYRIALIPLEGTE